MKIKYQLFVIEYQKFFQHYTDPFDTKEEAIKEIEKLLSDCRSDESFVILEVYSEA